MKATKAADWWTAWPGLYDSELAAFAARDAAIAVFHKTVGLLILDIDWPQAEATLKLRVAYSPLHPFVRPVIAAPSLQLGRHQHPFDANLCLITQASGEWRSSQRVADFIAEQLPKVLEANRARQARRMEDAAALEEQAPDPISAYFTQLAQPNCALFYSQDQRVPPGSSGLATFELAARGSDGARFEGVLRQLQPASGAWLGRAFAMPLSGATSTVQGRWVRMSPPKTADVDAMLAVADAEIERQTALRPGAIAAMRTVARAPRTITAIVFEEELGYGRGKTGAGWLFIGSSTDGATGQRSNVLIRGYRMTDDLLVRVPVAASLKKKRVLAVGVGAVGSFAALDWARAGVSNLDLIDFDVVEPGNTVRWPLGRPVWGDHKVLALKEFIERNYPQTNVRGWSLRIGATTVDPTSIPADGENPLSFLCDRIAEADVVVDTSASTECQEALAYYCKLAGKPLVVGYATEGAAGGVVARFRPDSGTCYVCLQEHWQDASFPKPAVDRAGTVTPIGCNDPTFTGASFDLQEVSLQVVRTAVGLLVGEEDDGWDVAVLSLQVDGKRCAPRWEVATLAPRCTGCAT